MNIAENYKFLSLTQDCTDSELESRYRELKSKYSDDRFKEGDEGRKGAENLTALEKAYSEIKQERSAKETNSEFGGDEYGKIDRLVKDNRLDEAQKELENIYTRTHKWHFLQSIVFYKRGWYLESKKQLQLAINLDPTNSQYRDSMQKLDNIIANENIDPRTFGRPGAEVPPTVDNSMQMADSCCTTLCCASCCCDLLRCL